MKLEFRPSKQVWNYFMRPEIIGKPISVLQIVSAVADKAAGYHISYSANMLLKDLKLLGPKGQPNKDAWNAVALYLHQQYHRPTFPMKIEVIDPTPQDNQEDKE